MASAFLVSAYFVCCASDSIIHGELRLEYLMIKLRGYFVQVRLGSQNYYVRNHVTCFSFVSSLCQSIILCVCQITWVWIAFAGLSIWPSLRSQKTWKWQGFWRWTCLACALWTLTRTPRPPCNTRGVSNGRPAICSDFVGAAPIFWDVLRALIAICRAPIF